MRSRPALPSSTNGPASFLGVIGPSMIGVGPTDSANCVCEVGVVERAPCGSLGLRWPDRDRAMLMG